MLKTLKKLKNRLFLDKYTAEVDFWINEIQEYQNWYDGKKNLWGHNPPLEKEKIIKYSHSILFIIVIRFPQKITLKIEASERSPHLSREEIN